jgi:hypothetical protein
MSGGADPNPNRSLLRRPSGPQASSGALPQRPLHPPPSPTRSNETKLNQFARGGGGRCMRLTELAAPTPI